MTGYLEIDGPFDVSLQHLVRRECANLSQVASAVSAIFGDTAATTARKRNGCDSEENSEGDAPLACPLSASGARSPATIAVA